MRTLSSYLAMMLLAGNAVAQTTADHSKSDEKKPRISLMAVGDAPSPEYAIKDGKRELGKTPESEYPPGMLFVKEGKDSNAFKQVNLGLNFPGEPIRHPGGAQLVLFEAKDDKKEGFVRVEIPEKDEDLTIFLTRNRATGSWRQKPVAHVMKNGLEAFPLNSVRVINFCRLPIKISTNDKVFELTAQGSRVVPLEPSEQGILRYKVAVNSEGTLFVVSDTAITYPMNGRINLVAYESDGKDKRQPVRVLNYFELPYRVPSKDDKHPAGNTATP